MARRRRTRSRTRTVYRTARSIRRRIGGSRGGKFGHILSGVIAGVAGSLLGKFLPVGGYSQPVADLGVGYFMGNDTLTTIGGRSIGSMLAGMVGSGSSSGGGYQVVV